MPLLLALSISSTFSADHSIVFNGVSSFQGLYAALSSVAESSSQICNGGRYWNRTRNWVKNNPIKTICACGALVALGYQVFTYYRNQQAASSLAALLHNPATSLEHLNGINDQFKEDVKVKELHNPDCSENKVLTNLSSLIKSYEEASPIFLLDERRQPQCPLTRANNPKYRERFEERVANALSAKIAASSDPVQYVGFASGSMYQELIILCKALKQNPNASIIMHFIDTEYASFVEMRDQMKHIHQIDVDSEQKLGEGESSDNNNHIQRINQVTIYTENKARQLIMFLKRAFPDAQLTLNLHQNGAAYLDYLKTYNLPYADVVCTADLDTEDAKKDYLSLCKIILEKRPESVTTLLAKDQNRVKLITISPDGRSGAEERKLKFNDYSMPYYSGKAIEIKVFMKVDCI